MGLFRPGHLLLILAVLLLVVGPSKLPQLGDALGKTIRGFKKAMNGPSQESNGPETSKPLEDEKNRL
jgi:sec-independent protein translocase protein TatA